MGAAQHSSPYFCLFTFDFSSLTRAVVNLVDEAAVLLVYDAALGALQILQKPFKAGELLGVIEAALSDAGAVSIER